MMNYNPSSLNSNRTILQMIEELKKYLMNNPLSCIYQTPSSVSVNTASLADVIVPSGQEIKSGDVVVSANGYYNFVDSVGTNIVYFSSDWVSLGLDVNSITLNFDSTYGEVVDTPANFTGWIYRRFSRPNDKYFRGRRYYLEITYKDSTQFPSTQTATIFIPSNYLNAIWYQLNVDNSTTIYFDFTEDASQGLYQETNFTIPAGQQGANGVSVVGATIDASNHLILTLSDSTTIDAGEISAGLTEVKASDVNSESATNGQVLTADGNGDASWQTPSTPSVEGTAVKSTGETSGKVLTADGSGNASWQNASGGSLYLHNIYFYGTANHFITLQIINTNSTPIDTIEALNTYLSTISDVNRPYHATGEYIDVNANETFLIIGVRSGTSYPYIAYIANDYNRTWYQLGFNTGIKDKVIQIS